MANPFRAFPPRKGGSADWSDPGPAGIILRAGFFGVPAGAQTLTPTAFTDPDSFGAATVSLPSGATGTLNLLEQNAGITTVTDVITGSITVTAGRPVFVIFVGSGTGTTSGTPHSLAGAGQTWTEIYGAPVAGDDSLYTRCSIWVSDAASGGSGALTITTPDQTSWSYAVVEFEPSAGATATIGTEVEATTAENATTNSVALTAADYWVALAGASKEASYGSLSATPRAGWTEAADAVAQDSGWLVGVHVQLSPLDGDTDASVTWSNNVNIPLVAVPITLNGGGGGGQTLTATIFADGDTFGTAAISVDAVTLTATAFTDADAFGAAVVGRGAVTLTGTLFADGDTFGAATVAAGAVTLTATILTDGDAFGGHTVTPGAVTLTPGLYSDADTFGAAVVSLGGATQDLTPAIFADGDAFGSHAVTVGPVSLTATILTDADAFGAATVSQVGGAAQNLTATRYDDAETFGAASITPGAVTLGPTRYGDADAFGAATVTRGAVAVSPTLFAGVNTFGAAIIVPGAVTLSATRYADPDEFGAATVAAFIPSATEPGRIAVLGANNRTATLDAQQRTVTFGAHDRAAEPGAHQRSVTPGQNIRTATVQEGRS